MFIVISTTEKTSDIIYNYKIIKSDHKISDIKYIPLQIIFLVILIIAANTLCSFAIISPYFKFVFLLNINIINQYYCKI